MDLRLVALQLDAPDPAVPAAFWAGLLGRAAVVEPGGTLVPGEGTQLGLRFVPSTEPKVAQNPVHLHLTSTSPGDQEATVARALELGGTHVDVGQLPEESHVVLADPGGNELCVIEPGNAFLEGTGFLGEVTCRGTRAVGLFWSEALGWPLVWDRDEETAVQSPDGGTKVSWGGEPVDPDAPPQRQRLVNDPDATARTGAAFRAAFGDQGVADPGLITGSEDVPALAAAAGAPLVYWLLGGEDPQRFAAAFAAGTLDSDIPSNHSPSFAPQLHPTLEHGVEALVVAAREWLD